MREAIDSALAQTYENVEILVINDGSTDQDETERTALSYGDKIRYYSKENGGCASALNFGISKMNGAYFSWLSHDDAYFPDKIQKQMEWIFKNPSKAENTVVSCLSTVIDRDGNIMRNVKSSQVGLLTPTQSFEKNILGGSFNGCALLIPKKILDRVGKFNEKSKYILDQEYWTRISLSGGLYYCMDDILVKNRRHKGQMSVKYKKLLEKETDDFMRSLYTTLSADNADVYFQKVLYYFCAKTYRKDISRKMATILKRNGSLSVHDKYVVVGYRIKRAFVRPAKKLYHALFIR